MIPFPVSLRAPIAVPVEIRAPARRVFRLAAAVGEDGIRLARGASFEPGRPVDVRFELPDGGVLALRAIVTEGDAQDDELGFVESARRRARGDPPLRARPAGAAAMTADRFEALAALERQAAAAGGAERDRPPARGRQADRARAHRAAARPRQLRRARQVRHPPLHRLRHGREEDPRRRRGHRLRHGRRAHGLRVRAGLHRVRRLAVRALRAEDLQGDGPGDEGRRAGRSASTTRAARASRRASSRSPATPTSSCATRWRPASCRSSRRSWARARAAPSTRRRSPTSSSWSNRTSYMFITGPDVIKTVTHEEVTKEELGGAHTHAARSGVAHRAFPDEPACLARLRELLSFLPQNNPEDPPRLPTQRPRRPRRRRARHARPARADEAVRHQAADRARRRRRRVLRDPARVRAATSSSASRASTAGRSASSPTSRRTSPAASTSTRRSRRRASCASATASTSRSSRSSTCPGFLPGTAQEYGGIIKHGAKLLYAFAEATVPKVTVITRKAYGGAYDVMASKHIRADVNFAYPDGRDRGHGARGAVNIVFRDELAKARRPGGGARALRRRVPREVRQPVQGGRARLHRRGHPPARDARPAVPARWRRWATSATRTRPRSTATFRCEANGQLALPRGSSSPLARAVALVAAWSPSGARRRRSR